MTAITLQITNAGRAALVAAGTAGTLPITIAQVGLSASTTVVPAATATSLPGEHRRISAIGGQAVAADTIHMIARDESADTYSVAAIALYLADGTMFAIYGQNTNILSKSAASIMLMAIDVKFADIAASSLTFGNANFLDPPATTTVVGVVELATNAETLAGTDTQRAIVPASLKYVLDNKLQGWVLKSGDTMTGRLMISEVDEAIRLRSVTPYLSGYSVDGATRYGTVEFAPTQTILRSDGGAVQLYTGGAARFTISAAGKASFASSVAIGVATPINTLHLRDAVGLVTIRLEDTVNQLGFLGSASGLATGAPTTALMLRAENALLLSGGGNATHVTIALNGDVTLAKNVGIDGYLFLRNSVGDEKLRLTGAVPYLTAYNAAQTARFGYIQWNAPNGNLILASDAGQVQLSAGNQFGFILDGNKDITGPRNVTLTGRLTAPTIAVGDANFAASIPAAGFARLTFDANDYIEYSRAGNAWSHVINNSTVAAFNAGGIAVTGTITINGNGVWHVGNDGAGSGLDADLLDGIQASSFAIRLQNVTFRDVTCDRGDGTGVLYLNAAQTRYLYFDGAKYVLPAAGLTINNGTAWHSANDGAGSGLDADLLDGFQASQFWRPDNDGAGSGMDADLLDGLEASAFPRIIASASSESGGYEIWSHGYKRCWGNLNVAAKSNTSVTYPISFNTWSKAFASGGTTFTGAADNNPFAGGPTMTGFSITNALETGVGVHWHAFGF